VEGAWERETDRLYGLRMASDQPGEAIGVINRLSRSGYCGVRGGSLPGDLHKLCGRGSQRLSLEYGYSCMGYEIAGGWRKDGRPVARCLRYGCDGSFLMMSSEIVTSIQEGYKLNIVLLDNTAFRASGLSQASARMASARITNTGPTPVSSTALMFHRFCRALQGSARARSGRYS